MSWWSYVTGSIRVHVPGRSQPEAQYILDTVLEHLPRVTGSEDDMHVHVVREHGHRMSSSCDEFGMRTNNLMDSGGFKTRRGWMEVQNYYILALEGYLRDRELRSVKEEFMKWICRLAKRVIVEDVFVRIWDYDSEFILNDREKFSDMWEYPSWSSAKYATGEPAWWEYLSWEQYPGSMMPLKHVYKYFRDEKVDAEIDRRRAWERSIEEGPL